VVIVAARPVHFGEPLNDTMPASFEAMSAPVLKGDLTAGLIGKILQWRY